VESSQSVDVGACMERAPSFNASRPILSSFRGVACAPMQVAVSLFCWSSGAVVCYFATAALQRATHAPIEAIGGIALACNFAVPPLICHECKRG
jgi:hypothetical protein